MKSLQTIFFCVLLQLLPTPLSAQPENGRQAIRLGATLPLSGDYASYGIQIRDGIELAKEKLRAQGFNIQVFYEDVPLPGRPAVTAIRKLISEDKIHALAGNFWNPAIPAMAPMINRNKIVSFHTAAADDLILDAGEYVFSTNAKIKDEARTLAEHAYYTLGARTAAILYIGTTFGENYSAHFAKQFEKLGGTILHNDVTILGDNDLRAPLTAVKRKNPDVFFAAYFGTNLGIVLKQAKEIGLHQQILGVYEAEDPSVLQTAESKANGLQYLLAEPEVDNKLQEDLRKEFQQRFAYSPSVLSRNAYDATNILVKTLAKCKLDPECSKSSVYQTKEYPGFSGTFSIDSDGGAEKKFVLKEIKHQQFVRLHLIDSTRKRARLNSKPKRAAN